MVSNANKQLIAQLAKKQSKPTSKRKRREDVRANQWAAGTQAAKRVWVRRNVYAGGYNGTEFICFKSVDSV